MSALGAVRKGLQGGSLMLSPPPSQPGKELVDGFSDQRSDASPFRVRFRLQLPHLFGRGREGEAIVEHPGSIAPPLGFLVGELRRHFAPLLAGGDKAMRYKHLFKQHNTAFLCPLDAPLLPAIIAVNESKQQGRKGVRNGPIHRR